MKLFSKAKISLITALITMLSVFGGYRLYADDFRLPNDDYEAVFGAYHDEMSSLFNSKVERLKEITKDGNFMKDPKKKADFLVPADIDQENDQVVVIAEKCRADKRNNVSPLCVSMESLAIYMDYVRILEASKGELAAREGATINSVLQGIGAKNSAIRKEVENARRVLENTLAVYNEFLHAYPMHIRYQEIIKQLLKYKLALKDIRKEVQFFPAKFIDATTTQCE